MDDVSASYLAAKRAIEEAYAAVLTGDLTSVVEWAIAAGRHAEKIELWAYREGRK